MFAICESQIQIAESVSFRRDLRVSLIALNFADHLEFGIQILDSPKFAKEIEERRKEAAST